MISVLSSVSVQLGANAAQQAILLFQLVLDMVKGGHNGAVHDGRFCPWGWPGLELSYSVYRCEGDYLYQELGISLACLVSIEINKNQT